jgi:hypothetical protein
VNKEANRLEENDSVNRRVLFVLNSNIYLDWKQNKSTIESVWF